jgi:transposase
MWVRDRLDGLWADEDFAGWYPRDGRPGISPAQLAMVSVLQFLLDLSDRDAAEAVRCRIDFKYALGLDLDDPGFHFSVLGDFRERLLEEGRADRLLDLALARLKAAGLVRERTAQRTDSTHVLAAVRDLTRLELVTETVRAALEELARTAGHALEGLIDDEWGRRYGRPARLGKNPTRPKTRMNQAGADGRRLLEHLAARFPGLLRGPRGSFCEWSVLGNPRIGDAGLRGAGASGEQARKALYRVVGSGKGWQRPGCNARDDRPRRLQRRTDDQLCIHLDLLSSLLTLDLWPFFFEHQACGSHDNKRQGDQDEHADRSRTDLPYHPWPQPTTTISIACHLPSSGVR